MIHNTYDTQVHTNITDCYLHTLVSFLKTNTILNSSFIKTNTKLHWLFRLEYVIVKAR